MSNQHIERGLHGQDLAGKLEMMRNLGQYQIVLIDQFTIGVIDPNDLIDEEPRLIGALDIRVTRGLDDLFRVLVGPALFLVSKDRSFLNSAGEDSQSGD
ncbi:hypothetical protein H3C70_00990 [Patescibacteria group bacterium]|nr:hypothetical protein [Patescibacteria group bacterium]